VSRAHAYEVRVEFGDCDPAQIVYFPNFYRWMDAAGRNFFVSCGVPPWTETERTLGIIGTPLVNSEARFLKPASYGDSLCITSEVTEWRRQSFVMRHQIRRDSDLIVDCHEVRVFARRVDGEARRIQAVPIPPELRALCEAPVASTTEC
jgi:4-hydroxybenzoyl-CoA thioesterase